MFDSMNSKVPGRIAAMLAVGGCALVAALGYRALRRPDPAPVAMQASGRQIVHEQLRRLTQTEFGQTQRGRMVLDQVALFLSENRIVFSARLGRARGLAWHEVLGRQLVFVKVIEMGEGRYLHQTTGQIMVVLSHEAVHWLNNSYPFPAVPISRLPSQPCRAILTGITR
jgi:hypothetical protein